MGSLKRALFPPLEFRIPLPRRPSSIAMYVRRGYKNPDSSLVWLPCSMATAPARPTFSVLTRGGSLSGSPPPLLGPPSPVPLRRGRNCQTLLPPPTGPNPLFPDPDSGPSPGRTRPDFGFDSSPGAPLTFRRRSPVVVSSLAVGIPLWLLGVQGRRVPPPFLRWRPRGLGGGAGRARGRISNGLEPDL